VFQYLGRPCLHFVSVPKEILSFQEDSRGMSVVLFNAAHTDGP